MRALLVSMLLMSLTSIAGADVIVPQLSAACMKLDNGTPGKCDCMAKKFATSLSHNENTYAIAILTLDESLLTPIKGNLNDKKAESVKTKIIPLMMDCLL